MGRRGSVERTRRKYRPAEGGTVVRNEAWITMVPGEDLSPATRHAAVERERDELHSERSMLLGRIDALQGELASLERRLAAKHERELRAASRRQGLTSIMAVGS